ncbi:MAG TPA: zinc ribbon domain-containing protein [Clostridia bacterium]|nr:zinc ribbon domain-containing protein [Clostridia bacterium]
MGNNNFNICPRCGTANSAVAKYCFQCGAVLKSTEQPVVCGKCNTVNSSSSTYCKSCGAALFEGNHSKICPRCKSVAASSATICSKCGYSFSGASTVEPVANPSGTVLKPPKKIKPVAVGSTKARVGGIIGMIFALTLIYFVMNPTFLYFSYVDFGIYALINEGGLTGTVMNGYDIIINAITSMRTSGIWSFLGSLTANQWIIYIVFVVTMITAFVQFFIGLARLINGRMAKKVNGFAIFMLVMTILTIIYLILCQNAENIAAVSTGVIKTVFTSWATISTTYLRLFYYIMSGYYLVLIVMSAVFRRPKQQVMQIGR